MLVNLNEIKLWKEHYQCRLLWAVRVYKMKAESDISKDERDGGLPLSFHIFEIKLTRILQENNLTDDFYRLVNERWKSDEEKEDNDREERVT